MTIKDIAAMRLLNQQVTDQLFTTPAGVVNYMCAMQAQEYGIAKWAIGMRLPNNKSGMPGSTDALVENDFNEGQILRTHLLRPTWHFVSCEDIRWLLALTAPRVRALNAFMNRKYHLDNGVFKKCNKVLERQLRNNLYLTRNELQPFIEKAGICTDGVGLSLLMMEAELQGIICSGPRKGKQFTYALLEERVPVQPKVNRDDALALLCKKYYTSRGPASIKDFSYWSGLTMKDAREGASSLGNDFTSEHFNGETFYFHKHATGSARSRIDAMPHATFLLADYDELAMAYKDRSALFKQSATHAATGKLMKANNPLSLHMFLINGLIAGTWQRSVKGKKLFVNVTPFKPLAAKQRKHVELAVKRYAAFFETDYDLELV